MPSNLLDFNQHKAYKAPRRVYIVRKNKVQHSPADGLIYSSEDPQAALEALYGTLSHQLKTLPVTDEQSTILEFKYMTQQELDALAVDYRRIIQEMNKPPKPDEAHTQVVKKTRHLTLVKGESTKENSPS